MSGNNEIPRFEGDTNDANAIYVESWRPQILMHLQNTCAPNHRHGLLGIALTPAEYATYEINPFIAFQNPAPLPAAANQVQLMNYQIDRDNYRTQETTASENEEEN